MRIKVLINWGAVLRREVFLMILIVLDWIFHSIVTDDFTLS